MYCQQCGKKNSEQDRFCQNCGQPITIQNQEFDHLDQADQTNEVSESDREEDQDLQAYIGPRFDYYRDKWALSTNPATAANWNWSACFFGIIWFGYRKMYRPIFILLTAYLALDIIDMLANFHPITSLIVDIAPYIAFGLIGIYGNAIYYRHAKKQISKFKQHNDRAQISKKGGTSKAGVLAAISLLFGYAIIYFILLSAFFTGTIQFGLSEGQYGIKNIRDQFEVTDTIYYEADFGETAQTAYLDVILFYQEGDREIIYAQFEEEISPDWTGFYNYFYDPTYDYLDPGHYIVRIYRDDQLLSEGEFSIK